MWGGSAEEMVERKNELRGLIGLSIALVAVALLFGLWPRGFDFSNHVRWLPNRDGIELGNFAIAYTTPIQEWGTAQSPPKEFSIGMALKARTNHQRGFGFVMAVHGCDDKTQVLVGQWRSWLIVMNGDDYDHRRKTKRISANLAASGSPAQLVTITTGRHGTSLYINGRLVAEREDLTLRIPSGQNTKLIIGNSPDGRHGWKGNIYGLAWYNYNLGPKDVTRHYREWLNRADFTFASKYNPFLLYLFDEGRGKRAIDHGVAGYDLQIPPRMVLSERKMLSFRWPGRNLDLGFLKDAFVNLVGFIPLGFVFMMTLGRWKGCVKKWDIGVVVLLCLTISLTIEILQAWIPSRSSDLTDLILNTLGGMAGGMIFVWGYGAGKEVLSEQDQGLRTKD